MTRTGLAQVAAIALGCGAAISSAAAQAQPPQPPQRPMFRSATRLVIQPTTVTDRSNRPILNLTADDFIVTENGVRQEVAFVELRMPQPAPQTEGTAPTVAATSTPASQGPSRRRVVFYFDMQSMPEGDQNRAYTAASTYLREGIPGDTLLAIMAYRGGVLKSVLDFTDDSARARLMLEALFDEDSLAAQEAGLNFEEDLGFGQNNSEFNIFNTDRQLAALQTAAERLESILDVKTLVYFGSGLRLSGTHNQAQVRATVNAAVRANVTLNPVDTRGLVASAPAGDATRASTGGVSLFSGQLAMTRTTRRQQSEDALYALAADTGGVATFNSNDLSHGVQRAIANTSTYYLIAYHSTHTGEDGRFRRVQIRLSNGRSANLKYRDGYYGPRPFAMFSSADKERQLEEALRLESPLTEVQLSIEVNYFQITAAEYFVPVSVKIPGAELVQARASGARANIDVIGEIKDEHGTTHRNVRDRLEFTVGQSTAQELASRPVQYETGFTLLPGRYDLKLLVRNGATGKIGTFVTAFEIPNLETVPYLPMSSVVLSSQRLPASSALFSVRRSEIAQRAHPLVHDGQRLVPSVTRVFDRQRTLFAFVQVYPPAGSGDVAAYLTFFSAGDRVFETVPVIVRPSAAGRGAAGVWLEAPLSRLPKAGTYEVQVTVLSPGASKGGFWRSTIVVVE